jgi:hypothetical protein
MIKWTKPNGLKIETIDNKQTVAYCAGLNWTRDNVDAGPTAADVAKMSKAWLRELIAEYGLDVGEDLNVSDMRVAVTEALFVPE